MNSVENNAPHRRASGGRRSIQRDGLLWLSFGVEPFLYLMQSFRFGQILVIRIEREATGDQAVARSGRAVAERAADALALQSWPGSRRRPAAPGTRAPCVPGRPSRSSRRGPRPARHAAGSPAGRCSRCRPSAFRARPACSGRAAWICRTTPDQRILRRLVAVAGRKDGRPLDVRVVVGTAAGNVDRRHAQFRKHAEQPNRFGQIDAQRLPLVDAEAKAIGQQRLRTASARPISRLVAYGTMSNTLKRTPTIKSG